MLLLMASACSLTLIVLFILTMGKLFKVWVTCVKNLAKVSCVICWSNRSRWNSHFQANLLDGDVLLVCQKRDVCLLLCTQSVPKIPACMENEIHKCSRLATWIKKDIQVDFLVINSSVVTYFPLIIYFSVKCTKYIGNRFMCQR